MFPLTHMDRLNLPPRLKNCFCFTELQLWKLKPRPIRWPLTLKTLILMFVARTPDLDIFSPYSEFRTFVVWPRTTTPLELHHPQPGSSLQGAQSMAMAVSSTRLKTGHLLTSKIKSMKQFKTWSVSYYNSSRGQGRTLPWLDHPHSWNGCRVFCCHLSKRRYLRTPQIWIGVFWRATSGLAIGGRKKEVCTLTRSSLWWYGKHWWYSNGRARTSAWCETVRQL